MSLKTPWALRDTKQTKRKAPYRALLAIVTRHPAPPPQLPPRGSYLSSFVEHCRLTLEAFVDNCNCFLDCKTFPCSMQTSVHAWIWNLFKYRAFKFFWFLSCKVQDCGYNKTTTKLDSLLKFKIRQILMRFLANPQPYIWHKLPQHVAIFLWRIWITVVF